MDAEPLGLQTQLAQPATLQQKPAATAAAAPDAAAGAGFDARRLVALWSACAAAPGDVPLAPFIDGCLEIRKIVGVLGAAFGIAAGDIAQKCGVLSQRLAELQAAAATQQGPGGVALTTTTSLGGGGGATGGGGGGGGGGVRPTLQFLVRDEVARGVAASNTAAYVSGARSGLRLLWFLDFIAALLGGLLASPDSTLSTAAKAAYRDALEPHHGWALRHTISAAMAFLPSRAAFFQGLAGPAGGCGGGAGGSGVGQPAQPPVTAGGDAAAAGGGGSVEAQLSAFLGLVEPVRAELWRFYGELGLTNLP